MAARASRYKAIASASFDERRMERQVVTITRATARRNGHPPQDARLHDISIYGCRLITSERQKPGQRLWLRIAGGLPIAAAVVWSDSVTAGCRFDTPISSALVRSITLDT